MLTQTILWGQDNLWNDRENILFLYKNYADTNYQYVIVDNTHDIAVGVYGADSLEIKHYIRPYNNGNFDNESVCDSIVINLLCDSCVEFHITQMSTSKKRKWIKISDSLYVSSKWVSKFTPADKTPTLYTVPIMKVYKNKSFTQIILFTAEFTMKKWKALKNKTDFNIN